MSRILLLGPPGIGKGTHASIVAKSLRIPHITMAPAFVENVARSRSFGSATTMTVAPKSQVSDGITTEMLWHRLSKGDTEDGFVLEGYPSTVEQVALLDDLLLARGAKVDRVVLLQAERGVVLDRLADSRRDDRVGDVYEIPSAQLTVYLERTEPICRIYENRGLLRVVNAEPSVAQVARAVTDALAGLERR